MVKRRNTPPPPPPPGSHEESTAVREGLCARLWERKCRHLQRSATPALSGHVMDPGVAEDTLLMHIRRGVEKTTFAEMTGAGLNLAV